MTGIDLFKEKEQFGKNRDIIRFLKTHKPFIISPFLNDLEVSSNLLGQLSSVELATLAINGTNTTSIVNSLMADNTPVYVLEILLKHRLIEPDAFLKKVVELEDLNAYSYIINSKNLDAYREVDFEKLEEALYELILLKKNKKVVPMLPMFLSRIPYNLGHIYIAEMFVELAYLDVLKNFVRDLIVQNLDSISLLNLFYERPDFLYIFRSYFEKSTDVEINSESFQIVVKYKELIDRMTEEIKSGNFGPIAWALENMPFLNLKYNDLLRIWCDRDQSRELDIYMKYFLGRPDYINVGMALDEQHTKALSKQASEKKLINEPVKTNVENKCQ